MQVLKNISVFIVLLLVANSLLMAQVDLPVGSQLKILEITSRIADIDSSLQVDQYTLVQRRQLLNQLYKSDQRYRDSLINGSKSAFKQQLFTHKMVANDQSNQRLLSKLVSKFGWPTRQHDGDQATFTAWLIVWHAKSSYQSLYYPLIKNAYQQGMITQNPHNLQERMKRYFK